MVGKRHLDVVCGVIGNEAGQVLVALRDFESDQGGLWEFPGGKLEFSEVLEDGLCRELYEELDIDILEADPWMQVNYEYPLYHVTLHVWRVVRYEGEPKGQEGQIIQWVDRNGLKKLKFPPANGAIVDALLQEELKISS
ncbi:MAG: hypothetical protein A3F10_02765 [Coxiella sp. RIFCSPHIGHO2_12_FULL_42_15]|nr:MAG: hypothetical protein A3F10_02765 [Coxiella sp. RIFCSPHIGHO2_12_FULL_42_15]